MPGGTPTVHSCPSGSCLRLPDAEPWRIADVHGKIKVMNSTCILILSLRRRLAGAPQPTHEMPFLTHKLADHFSTFSKHFLDTFLTLSRRHCMLCWNKRTPCSSPSAP